MLIARNVEKSQTDFGSTSDGLQPDCKVQG